MTVLWVFIVHAWWSSCSLVSSRHVAAHLRNVPWLQFACQDTLSKGSCSCLWASQAFSSLLRSLVGKVKKSSHEVQELTMCLLLQCLSFVAEVFFSAVAPCTTCLLDIGWLRALGTCRNGLLASLWLSLAFVKSSSECIACSRKGETMVLFEMQQKLVLLGICADILVGSLLNSWLGMCISFCKHTPVPERHGF